MYLIKHILLQGAKLPSLVAACPGDGLWWTRRAGGGQEVVWRPRHWSTPKPIWSLSRHLMLLKRMLPHLPPGRGSYPEPRDKVQEGVQHDLKSQCRQELGPQEERARLGVRVCVCVCPRSIWPSCPVWLLQLCPLTSYIQHWGQDTRMLSQHLSLHTHSTQEPAWGLASGPSQTLPVPETSGPPRGSPHSSPPPSRCRTCRRAHRQDH